jgi:hypothetical protein
LEGYADLNIIDSWNREASFVGKRREAGHEESDYGC